MNRYVKIGVAAVVALSLSACASVNFNNPQTLLNAASAGVAGLEASYVTICGTGALPNICKPEDRAKAQALEQAILDAINVAQGLIDVVNNLKAGTAPTQDQIDAAIDNVSMAVKDFSNFVSSLQVKQAEAKLGVVHGVGSVGNN